MGSLIAQLPSRDLSRPWQSKRTLSRALQFRCVEEMRTKVQREAEGKWRQKQSGGDGRSMERCQENFLVFNWDLKVLIIYSYGEAKRFEFCSVKKIHWLCSIFIYTPKGPKELNYSRGKTSIESSKIAWNRLRKDYGTSYCSEKERKQNEQNIIIAHLKE